jgi:hypothetical protein
VKAFLNKYLARIIIAFFIADALVLLSGIVSASSRVLIIVDEIVSWIGVGVLLLQFLFAFFVFILLAFIRIITEKRAHSWGIAFVIINTIFAFLILISLPHC